METVTSYGITYSKNCPVCLTGELNASKASDVNFGDISTDIILIYCPKCKHIEHTKAY